MAKKNLRSKRTASSNPPPRRFSNRADPVSRLARFCEFAALGLVAASALMEYPDTLHLSDKKPVNFELFKEFPLKAAVIIQHTRTVWVALAVIGILTATAWYRTRHTQPRSRIVAFSPLAILLVIGIHITALSYLGHQHFLTVQSYSTADDALAPITIPMDLPPTTASASNPTSAPATSVSSTAPRQPATRDEARLALSSVYHLQRAEGTKAQWQLLAAGDALYSAPVTIAWTLSLLISRLHRKGVDVSGTSRLT